MNKLYLLLLSLPLLTSAQKFNTFVDAGAHLYSSGQKNYVTPVFSTIFDYVVSPQFSFGAGIELNSFTTYHTFSNGTTGNLLYSLSPLADFRYYFLLRTAALIPIFQFGYDLYKDNPGATTGHPTITTTGSFQYTVGMGLYLGIFKNDRGLMLSVKYINRRFKETTANSSPPNNVYATDHFSVRGFAPTIGIKF